MYAAQKQKHDEWEIVWIEDKRWKTLRKKLSAPVLENGWNDTENVYASSSAAHSRYTQSADVYVQSLKFIEISTELGIEDDYYHYFALKCNKYGFRTFDFLFIVYFHSDLFVYTCNDTHAASLYERDMNETHTPYVPAERTHTRVKLFFSFVSCNFAFYFVLFFR